MTNLKDHPLQPIIVADDGTPHCQPNAIVRFLLDAGPFDMNQLALMPFDDADREQFAQLLGCSVSGLSERHYVSDKTVTFQTIAARNALLAQDGQKKKENE